MKLPLILALIPIALASPHWQDSYVKEFGCVDYEGVLQTTQHQDSGFSLRVNKSSLFKLKFFFFTIDLY